MTVQHCALSVPVEHKRKGITYCLVKSKKVSQITGVVGMRRQKVASLIEMEAN